MGEGWEIQSGRQNPASQFQHEAKFQQRYAIDAEKWIECLRGKEHKAKILDEKKARIVGGDHSNSFAVSFTPAERLRST